MCYHNRQKYEQAKEKPIPLRERKAEFDVAHTFTFGKALTDEQREILRRGEPCLMLTAQGYPYGITTGDYQEGIAVDDLRI